LLHDLTKALVLQLRFFVKNFLKAETAFERPLDRTFFLVLLTPEDIFSRLQYLCPAGRAPLARDFVEE
jgi:hypothetical protein